MNRTLLQSISDEVNQYNGIYVPVHAGFLQRHLVRRLPVKRLRPNPNDEFCSPEVGPNSSIIARYALAYQTKTMATDMQDFISGGSFEGDNIFTPLIVQKIHPNGYMIPNGHHRWAAARQIGRKTLPVRIVNLTQKKDIEEAMNASVNTRRATLDLDEVVLCKAGDAPAEKPLRFPLNCFYPERVRLGIPELFYQLSQMKYDIWVYSSRYHSMDQITRLLGHHHTHITCAVTGTARKGPPDAHMDEKLESMLSRKYTTTVHIDRHSILHVNNDSKTFEEVSLSGSDTNWSREIIDRLGKAEALKR